MREEQKGAVKNSIGRIFITALLILIQVVWLIELFIRLNTVSYTHLDVYKRQP